jgi:serine/threonine-protein kinase
MTLEIPNYRIVAKLGVGAGTRIFRARCMRTGRDYSVKTVAVRRPEDMQFVEFLRAEHAIGSAIDHPNVRKVYELRMIRQRFRVSGAILFMEYVDGIAMSEQEFRRTPDDVLRLFVQVAEGVHAMHVAGFVHADLKPNNILVTPDDGVKLIDLGQSERRGVAKNRIQGTVDYIAPEQVGRGTLDQRTDVFGLGAVLHRVLTGRAIATQMNQNVSVNAANLVGKRVEDLRRDRGDAIDSLPACLAKLVQDCCASDPLARPSDMPSVIHRIETARTILRRLNGAATASFEPTACETSSDDVTDEFDPDEVLLVGDDSEQAFDEDLVTELARELEARASRDPN